MVSCFRLVCVSHSIIEIISGSLILFFLQETAMIGLGKETSSRLVGSTPRDQLLITTSESLVGICYIIIGIILFMVSFITDRDFQGFFAKGCVLIHALMAAWRLSFEGKIDDVAWDWPRQVVGDFVLAMSWVFFLTWNWRERYD